MQDACHLLENPTAPEDDYVTGKVIILAEAVSEKALIHILITPISVLLGCTATLPF